VANITSVSAHEKKPSTILPGLLIVVGLFAILGAAVAALTGSRAWSGVLIGVVMFAAGYAIGQAGKSIYSVRIGSASGEPDALASTDKEHISNIVSAMNDAIVERG
jgi:hypothetical protein